MYQHCYESSKIQIKKMTGVKFGYPAYTTWRILVIRTTAEFPAKPTRRWMHMHEDVHAISAVQQYNYAIIFQNTEKAKTKTPGKGMPQLGMSGGPNILGSRLSRRSGHAKGLGKGPKGLGSAP